MEAVQSNIRDLVRTIVRHPDQVVVTPVDGLRMAFHVRVSRLDYELVLSKIHAIHTLAGAFAGLSEEQKIFIQVTPVLS